MSETPGDAPPSKKRVRFSEDDPHVRTYEINELEKEQKRAAMRRTVLPTGWIALGGMKPSTSHMSDCALYATAMTATQPAPHWIL